MKYELTKSGKEFVNDMKDDYDCLDNDFVNAVDKAVNKLKVKENE